LSKDKDKGQFITQDLWERTRRRPEYREWQKQYQADVDSGDVEAAERLHHEIARRFAITRPKEPSEDMLTTDHPHLFFDAVPVMIIPKDEKGYSYTSTFRPTGQEDVSHIHFVKGGPESFVRDYLRHGVLLRVDVDLNETNEILIELFTSAINLAKAQRKEYGYPETSRHLEKRQRYYKVWDERAKWRPKATFREIASTLPEFAEIRKEKGLARAAETAKKDYYRAYELIHRKPYDPNLSEELKKEYLELYCDVCPEQPTCTELCPSVLPFVDQDEVKQRELLTRKPLN